MPQDSLYPSDDLLREDGLFALYRCPANGERDSVLILTPVGEPSASTALARIGHENSLAPDLDPAWALQPLELVSQGGRTVLVLADPGGQPLSRLLDRPLTPSQFIPLAIEIAAALGHVHRCGLIHRDVNAANVFVDETGRVRLTGFGVASRLRRTRQALTSPELIAGTPAYVSPEQTGRINRSGDMRSDLYSLGATFYEMLAGAPPFATADTLEVLHCHIARQPVPLTERVNGLPPQLDEIVLKLLAKDPSKRYQTVAGLVTDLRRCAAEWWAHGRIDRFPLGADDLSDRLMIPEKVYGRQAAVDTLLAAFDRVANQGSKEFVFCSGRSGVGKSSVVNELQKAVLTRRALFATGKFDRDKLDVPYAPLAYAFRNLVRQILGLSDAALMLWRSALLEAVGSNGQLLTNLIPDLELVIGPQPPLAGLPAKDALNLFQLTFERFLRVFARPEHPLVLFVDDLQWGDGATLDLLRRWLVERDPGHLLIIGAYRDDEVGPAHPLTALLATTADAEIKRREIHLTDLTCDDLAQLLADALRLPPRQVAPLAEVVHGKTGGNPFFALQFIDALIEGKLLVFDRDAMAWTWDILGIRGKRFTDNVGDLLEAKLALLSSGARDALKIMACLGNEVNTALLQLAAGVSSIGPAMDEAIRAGVIYPTSDGHVFLHDRIREAAYALIVGVDRAAVHLSVGRAIMPPVPLDELGERVFEIADQIKRGEALVADRAERERFAALNLAAGRRAKLSGAYLSALAYFVTGSGFLDSERWDRQHRLAFDLEFHRAECELLDGEFAAGEARLSTLMARAGNAGDRAAVTRLLALLYITISRNDRCVEVCLDYLRGVGFDLSPHPTEDATQEIYRSVQQTLGDRRIEDLPRLALMTDATCLATLDVLTAIAPPGIVTDVNLHRVVVGHMVNLTLAHGNTDASCVAYVMWGVVLQSYFASFHDGYRFAKLGLDLADRADRYKPRVTIDFATVADPWKRHLSLGLPLLRRAFGAAQDAGDFTYAGYSCYNLVIHLLALGAPLEDVRKEAEAGLSFARMMRYELLVHVVSGQLALIRCLQGQTNDFALLDGADFNEERMERLFEQAPRFAIGACSYWIRKLQSRFFASDFAAAAAAAAHARRLLWGESPPSGIPSLSARLVYSPEFAEFHFFAALALAACGEHDTQDQASDRLATVRAHCRQLERWAEQCPENFQDRATLVAAEIARIEGRDLAAEQLFERAIASAREHGFIQNEAIANEAAARFYAARGLQTSAAAYRRNARQCYQRWGAVGKVNHIDVRHPELAREPAAGPFHTSLAAYVAQLDISSVVRASQAVSGEILLDRLIETLMTIALEHAGAERGLLIFPCADGYRIEAEATTGPHKVTVALRQSDITAEELPETLLRLVVRTRQSVILDDGVAQGPFATDGYMQRRRPRSVLCLPLVKQSELIGLLYLENNLAPGTFTPMRIAVLEVLASQAAISIENARLYDQLIKENRDRQKAEAALRTSEAMLADAQRISRTASWYWNVKTGEVRWSEEYYRLLDFDLAVIPPSRRALVDRVHPDDLDAMERATQQSFETMARYEHEYRVILPDGTVHHHLSVGHPGINQKGELEFVGAVLDITERKRAEEVLRNTQAELARVARLTTMGELTASIAHEINQPLGAIVINASACLEWLNRAKPDLDEARDAVSRIANDGMRAGDVIRGLRALARKNGPDVVAVDIDRAIQEVLSLTHGERQQHHVGLRTSLSVGNQPVFGDRVQLQQVILNLVMNGIEAMSAVNDRPRVLTVSSEPAEAGSVLVTVEDTGPGLDQAAANRIFDPFFTTKPEGMGMGLSICRSIVEAHGGRLSAAPKLPHGACFRFTLSAEAARLVLL